MYIDYLTLMLVNLMAGLFLLAHFIWRGLGSPVQRFWAPGFAMTGFVALITGLVMTFTWPLPSSYNIPFGEMSVLYGTVFLGAALAMGLNWDLLAVATYALFAGIAAIIVGVRVIELGLTTTPIVTGIGFILTGVGGVLALPGLYWRGSPIPHMVGAAGAVIAALVWAFVSYSAYWTHLQDFSKYLPPGMR
ncbi:MAG: DUF981 domain-containing protein [Actinobacteria bacterium]|nr:DUF981 domain-containing protein [Actinomycetota bacterium]